MVGDEEVVVGRGMAVKGEGFAGDDVEIGDMLVGVGDCGALVEGVVGFGCGEVTWEGWI